MIEVPFDDVQVGEKYFIKFYGETLEELIQNAGRNTIATKFYGECIDKFDKSLRDPNYPPNTMALTWNLSNDETEAGVNTSYKNYFNDYQALCGGGFTSNQTIRYFRRGSGPDSQDFKMKNKLMDQIFSGYSGLNGIYTRFLGPETKRYIIRKHRPLDNLVKGTEYLVYVDKGNDLFNEEKKHDQISGSFIGTFMGFKRKYIFCRIKFIDEIYKTHPRIEYICKEGGLRGDRVFTEIELKKPSGLNHKIDEGGCIALNFLDFRVSLISVAYIFKTLKEDLNSSCYISGGKISRKHKRRKSSKTRKF